MLTRQRPWLRAIARDFDRLRVEKSCLSLNLVDAVPDEIFADQPPLRFDDGPFAVHEVGDRDVLLHVEVHAVQAALPEAGEVERRLAQRLGWNGAGVDRGAARARRAVDDGDALAEVRRLC